VASGAVSIVSLRERCGATISATLSVRSDLCQSTRTLSSDRRREVSTVFSSVCQGMGRLPPREIAVTTGIRCRVRGSQWVRPDDRGWMQSNRE
jgi:hypothetical protein